MGWFQKYRVDGILLRCSGVQHKSHDKIVRLPPLFVRPSGSNYYCGCGYMGELRTFSSVLRQHENAMKQAKHTTNTLQNLDQKTAGLLAGSVGPSVPGRRGRAHNERGCPCTSCL